MKRLMMAGIAIGLSGWCFAEPSITDVTAQQHYPWNGKVDIFYTVENAGKEELVLAVWAVDETTGITNVAKNVTGDTEYASGQHKIVWDMSADGLKLVSESVVFAVAYKEQKQQDGLYCVIDLSGGTSAASYSVSYLPDIPLGGWSDEYKTTKLVLRKIKAGTFTMGSPTDEVGRSDNETQHQVTLTKDYWMGVFEVTQRQWELVMGTRPSYFNNDACYASRPVETVSYDMIRGSSAGAGWPNSSDVDSASFLGVLRQKSGLALDLPTEAQWEYACRAGTTTALNSGKNLTSTGQDAEMDKVGRYRHNGSGYSQSCDVSAGTAKVGSYAPNAWGLYDMHGNVCEWCLDWYGSYAGDETDPKGSSSGSYRRMRGGEWFGFAYDCRSAARGGDVSALEYNTAGFRLVLDERNSLGGVQLWEGGPYWAECNVGATKPEEYGYYFWWGDTVGYKRNADNNGWISVKDGASFSFASDNCPTYDKNSSQLQSAGYVDSTGNLVAAHDAATAHRGAPWRLPTHAEFYALCSNCTKTWITTNGVYGRLVTGKGAYASKSIFLPAAGWSCDSSLNFADSDGFYWTSMPTPGDSDLAWYLDFYSREFSLINGYRYFGRSVRPLRPSAHSETSCMGASEPVCVDLTAAPDGGPYTETIGEVAWTFVVTNNEAVVASVPKDVAGDVTIPSVLGGRTVTGIGANAFGGCGALTSVTIPSGVAKIGVEAFYGCLKLADVTFEGETVATIAGDAFAQCNWDLVVHVPNGWTGRSNTLFGHSVVRDGAAGPLRVELTVTNVVVQYVLNSIQPEIAVPVSGDTGFVAVITEVKSSGAVSVPVEWKDNYSGFTAKYGTDFGKALMKLTDKRDGAGNAMCVWQDFVAGTDPTDEDDAFTASITTDANGKLIISYTPELSDEEKAKRVYKTLGKVKLQDKDWVEVPAGSEGDYNFFKVTVEMK